MNQPKSGMQSHKRTVYVCVRAVRELCNRIDAPVYVYTTQPGYDSWITGVHWVFWMF